MQYPENISSAYSGYFATEVNFGNGFIGKLKALGRTMGLGGIKRQFARLLSDFNPDVVHLNNIHSYLSPVLAAMAHSRGIKVVWTLHDYKLACPSYSCLCQGRTCEKCFTGMKTGVVPTSMYERLAYCKHHCLGRGNTLEPQHTATEYRHVYMSQPVYG